MAVREECLAFGGAPCPYVSDLSWFSAVYKAPAWKICPAWYVLLDIVGEPAPSLGFVPIFDVEIILDRLPAQARADLAWAKRPIREGLRRLCEEPLEDRLLNEVSELVWIPLAAVTQALFTHLAVSRDALLAELMSDLEREQQRFKGYLGDEDAIDTLEWVRGTLQTIFVQFLSIAPPGQLFADVPENFFREVATHPGLRALRRGLVAFMAAVEGVKISATAERVAELLDFAFIEIAQFRKELGKHLWLPPFPYQTVEERRRRALHYAERLRQTLSPEDLETIEQSRMRKLR